MNNFTQEEACISKPVARCSRLFSLLVCMTVLSVTAVYVKAQTPTVTINAGIPSGNAGAKGVAWGNGIYVSILSGGSVYTSTDGESWEKVTDPGLPAGTYNSLVFGAGIFVIAGHSGLLLTSPDGQSWTTRNLGTGNHLYNVQFIQSNFYVVGQDQTIFTSADAVNWNSVTIGVGLSTDDFQSITWGNGAFVIGARQQSGGRLIVYRSTTAASNSWSHFDIAFATMNRVQFLKDKFFIFCSNTNIYTSSDGSSWTNSTASLPLTLPNATVTTMGSPNQAFNGIYDGSKIYLFGSSGYYSSGGSGYGSVFSSADGVNFTLQTRTVYIVCQGAAFVNNKYFQFGNEGVVSSVDGITYQYPTGSYNAMATNGSSYVSVGTVSSSGVIFTSGNFTNWTNRTPSGQAELTGVVYTGSGYVAAGNQSVLESTDNGVTWNTLSTPGIYFTGLAYGPGILAAGGYDPNTWAGSISYSSDGITWNTGNSDDNYYFKTKYVNGLFFALGISNSTLEGVIMHSADGINWTDVTPSLAHEVAYYNDVLYDGTRYHFMGMEANDADEYDYDDFFSLSTTTPANPASYGNKGTITTAPGGSQLGGWYGEGAFAYSNGHFVGSVIDINTNESFLLYSDNGTDWTAEAVTSATVIYSAMVSGNNFMLMGTNDGKITVSYGGSLPVTYNRFTAIWENQTALLQWETATESNSRYFIVQHSTNGQQWQVLGTVNAAGNSSTLQKYQYRHNSPAAGVNYYRLAQVDVDGKQEFSAVVKLQTGQQPSLQLYPNPVTDWVQLQLPGTQPALVRLFTQEGKQVYQQRVNGNAVKLLLPKMSPGMYVLEVKQNGQVYTQPLYRK